MSNNLAVKDISYDPDSLASYTPISYVVHSKIPFCSCLRTVTHNICNQQAVQIMKSDGWYSEAGFLSKNLDQIDMGTSWADINCRGFSHCYNPVTKRGYFNCPSAVEECRKYFDLAKSSFIKHRYGRAFFYLGAAVHLVQDLCVPHHSHNVIFNGHQRFEKWTEAHVENYLVSSHGLYNSAIKDPGEWVIKNAQASFDLFSFTKNTLITDYHEAAKAMFPRAQKTSAGFFLFFLESAIRP